MHGYLAEVYFLVTIFIKPEGQIYVSYYAHDNEIHEIKGFIYISLHNGNRISKTTIKLHICTQIHY